MITLRLVPWIAGALVLISLISGALYIKHALEERTKLKADLVISENKVAGLLEVKAAQERAVASLQYRLTREQKKARENLTKLAKTPVSPEETVVSQVLLESLTDALEVPSE